jgi:hypothetical protein
MSFLALERGDVLMVARDDRVAGPLCLLLAGLSTRVRGSVHMSPWLRSACCEIYVVLLPTTFSPPVCPEDFEDREGSDWGVVLRWLSAATCLRKSFTSGVFSVGDDLDDAARGQHMSLDQIVRVYVPVCPVSASGLTVVSVHTGFA